VKVGDYAAFATTYEEIEDGRTAIGKAFDNRAGCAALIELLRGERYPFDLIAAFTVQEEVGLRGAGVAAYGARPDLVLVLECTPAYDLPNQNDVSANVILGRGPSIYVMDSRTIQHRPLVAHIRQTAEAAGIPYQIRQPGGGGTNTGAMQRQLGGIPAATIATPGRYCHSPVSMINLDDYSNVVRLAEASLRNLMESGEWRVGSGEWLVEIPRAAREMG
jgi:endoglucanase